MKPTQLLNLIVSRVKAGLKRPVHVESSPGMGKTQIAHQASILVAKESGKPFGFKMIHAPLLQPEDYGFPVISSDRKDVSFVVSKEKFPLLDSDCEEEGLLCIDELSQADNSAQKILRNLIQEREIHGKKLKPGWSIITTGNRTTDRAGANRILSHLSNVLTRVELELNLDDWTEWAFSAGIKAEVISFIRFRPALLNTFDAHAEVNATPRAWAEGVSMSLHCVDPSMEFEVFKGDVGEGPAAEFVGFMKLCRNLPSPDAIVLNPDGIAVPKDSATLYALSGALAHKTTATNFERIMRYVKRMPAEFSVLYIRDAIRLTPAIQTSKEFIQWASKEGAKLLS